MKIVMLKVRLKKMRVYIRRMTMMFNQMIHLIYMKLWRTCKKDEERNKKELNLCEGNSGNDMVDRHVDLQENMRKESRQKIFLMNRF